MKIVRSVTERKYSPNSSSPKRPSFVNIGNKIITKYNRIVGAKIFNSSIYSY